MWGEAHSQLKEAIVDVEKTIRSFEGKDYGFEILAYTPEEFQEVKRRSIIIKNAMKYWIKLY